MNNQPEVNNSNILKTFGSKNIISKPPTKKKILKPKIENFDYQYVKEIEEMKNGNYMYKLNNDFRTVLTMNGEIIFKNKEDKVIKVSLK